ncbi:MAG: STT3 domain-containing protein [Phycisphaerae bacterium]
MSRKNRKVEIPEPVIPECQKTSKIVRIAIHVFGITIPILIGLFLRFNSLSYWNNQPEFNYNGTPILTTADAPYFTRYAKEYLKGEYKTNKPDWHRDSPDKEVVYPDPIPMISYMTAKISQITKADVNHVAFYLPPILAVLCVIPIYLIGVEISGFFVGFAGAILAVSFQLYLARSCLGRFDTDCLNLFFLFFISYFLLLAWRTTSRRNSFIHAAAAGLSLLLFNWWYAHPGFALPFLVFFVIMLFLPRKKQPVPTKVNLILIAIFALFSNPLQYLDAVASISGFIKNHLLLKSTGGYGFPNILISVSESSHYTIAQTLSTINNLPIGIAGMIGLAWLIIKTRIRFLPLLPVLALGLLAFKSGNRYAMYIAPFIGMGLGFLAERIHVLLIDWKLKSIRWHHLAVSVLTLICVWATVSPGSLSFKPQPRFFSSTYRGIDALNNLSPDGYVWTWWDWGYAIEDIGNKSTFTDGGSYRKAYFVGKALSTTQPAECRNDMLGVANLGFDGIYREMKKQKIQNPEPILDQIAQGKFNIKPDKPLYLMFTNDMISKFGWIYYFGTWDFARQEGNKTNVVNEFMPKSKQGSKLYCDRGVIDLEQGVMEVPGGTVSLQKIFLLTSDAPPALIGNYRSEGYIGAFLNTPQFTMFYIIHPDVFDTVFVQMYLMKNYDKNFFELVFNDYPITVVYKVK